MYVITAHQRYRQTDRQTDRRTDVKRSHDRYIAKACSGKNHALTSYSRMRGKECHERISDLAENTILR